MAHPLVRRAGLAVAGALLAALFLLAPAAFASDPLPAPPRSSVPT